MWLGRKTLVSLLVIEGCLADAPLVHTGANREGGKRLNNLTLDGWQCATLYLRRVNSKGQFPQGSTSTDGKCITFGAQLCQRLSDHRHV